MPQGCVGTVSRKGSTENCPRRYTVDSAIEAPTTVIRDIGLLSEMREVETLQKEVWGCDDRDVVPLTVFIAMREVGAVLIGAYDGPSLVGFVFGFPGYENGQIVHHSHMLAVKRLYRNLNLGYRLKLAQRERVLGQGGKRITWTFDPLQSLNAYFNFGKLGVLADRYKINFYGEATSSFLHQIGTDRLWVTWPLDSQRVSERLQTEVSRKVSSFETEHLPSLVQVGTNDTPQRNESPDVIGRERLFIEIPDDLIALQDRSPEWAFTWREALRWAFIQALDNGYLVEEFKRGNRGDRSIGIYLLSYQKKIEDFV